MGNPVFDTFSAHNQTMLEGLSPEMQAALSKVLMSVKTNQPDYNWKINSGYRTPEEQDKLFAQGAGVTKARGNRSYHNYKLAADIYPMTKDGIPSYENAKAAYDAYGKAATEAGLIWGGTKNWGGPEGDFGHVQLNTPPPWKQSNEISEIQTQLIKRGYNPGTIDGSMGPKTQAAIKQFQQANGLVPDGIVGKKTRPLLFGEQNAQ